MNREELLEYRSRDEIIDLQFQNPFNQKEAMCLMIYKCKVCQKEEVIWNSRPRVSPFSINCSNEECNKTMGAMTHIDWELDTFAPNYRPRIGERIFVDYSREAVRLKAERTVSLYWDKSAGEGIPSLSDYNIWDTKEDYVKQKVDEFEFGQPSLETITRFSPAIHKDEDDASPTRLTPTSPTSPNHTPTKENINLFEDEDMGKSLSIEELERMVKAEEGLGRPLTDEEIDELRKEKDDPYP